MNDRMNNTTKADFVEALNGEHTASTHDQLSLDVEPAKTFKVGNRVLLTDHGVQCVLTNFQQTKNVTNAAQAAGISHATLSRMLRNSDHPNHKDLAAHLPPPRRHGSPEYLEHERKIARVYQALKETGAPFEVIYRWLRSIDYKTASGHRAADMTDPTLRLHCRDFFENYDFEESIAEQIDQVEPDELPSSDFALSTEGDLVLQLAEQLTELYYQSKRLIEAINESTRDKATHYANDLNGMLYKAMTDAKQEN